MTRLDPEERLRLFAAMGGEVRLPASDLRAILSGWRVARAALERAEALRAEAGEVLEQAVRARRVAGWVAGAGAAAQLGFLALWLLLRWLA